MNDEFKIGDVVQLISGSMNMTVIRIYQNSLNRNVVDTMWHCKESNSLKKQTEIPPNALKVV